MQHLILAHIIEGPTDAFHDFFVSLIELDLLQMQILVYVHRNINYSQEFNQELSALML